MTRFPCYSVPFVDSFENYTIDVNIEVLSWENQKHKKQFSQKILFAKFPCHCCNDLITPIRLFWRVQRLLGNELRGVRVDVARELRTGQTALIASSVA